MTNFFKKIARGAGKLFSKVKHGFHDTFKKGGYLQQGIHAVTKVGGKILDIGEKVVGAVERSPFGAVFAPVTSIARTGLNIGKRVVGVANVAGNALVQGQNSVSNREDVGKIVGNALEKAKIAQAIAKPKYI